MPIDVVTRSELNRTGSGDLSQQLQAQIPSFNFPRPSLTDGTDHVRPATLRGLAPDQTLVLVNGKRRHTSALVNLNGSIGRGSVSTDFNAIPSGDIERVEVLRDGASAQYGSDAIAGVINVILRKDIGWGLDLSYGETKKGDGDDYKLDAYSGVSSAVKVSSRPICGLTITRRRIGSKRTRASNISASVRRARKWRAQAITVPARA